MKIDIRAPRGSEALLGFPANEYPEDEEGKYLSYVDLPLEASKVSCPEEASLDSPKVFEKCAILGGGSNHSILEQQKFAKFKRKDWLLQAIQPPVSRSSQIPYAILPSPLGAKAKPQVLRVNRAFFSHARCYRCSSRLLYSGYPHVCCKRTGIRPTYNQAGTVF